MRLLDQLDDLHQENLLQTIEERGLPPFLDPFLVGTGANTEYFFMFDIPSFKSTELFTNNFGLDMTFEEFEKPFDFIHKKIMGE